MAPACKSAVAAAAASCLAGATCFSVAAPSAAAPQAQPRLGTAPTAPAASTATPAAAGVASVALLGAVGLAKRKPGKRAAAVACRALAVGSEVSWKGKQATVRYLGETKFAAGDWAGLELKEGGMHNGTVMGVSYFECPAGCGVFAQPAQLVAADAAPAPAAAPAAAPAPAATAAPSISVGATVTWMGKPAVVRFVGPTKFAAGDWVGLEVEGGMHNGTVMGVTYYDCPPGKGAFAQASQLGGAAAPAAAAPAAAAPAAAAAGGGMKVGDRVAWNGHQGTVRFVGATEFAAGEWVGVELETAGGMHNGSVMGISYFKCAAGHGIFAWQSALQVLVGARGAL